MIIKLVLLSLYVTLSTEKKAECTIQEHSYMVSILYGGGLVYEPSCSGTLLSQYWVLTSGSCLTECDVPQLYIAVASQGRNPKNSSAKYCYLYPDHTRTVDLALMELETPITLNSMISYVNLANYLDVADRQLSAICKEAMAVGLGNKQPLNCVRSTVLPEMRCKNSLNHSSIRNEHCCVSALENAKPCPIAKGGPLMCRGVQYGVVTYSYPCRRKGQPVLVTRVDRYEKFIKGVILDRYVDENDFKSKCSTNNIITLWIFTFLLIFRFFN